MAAREIVTREVANPHRLVSAKHQKVDKQTLSIWSTESLPLSESPDLELVFLFSEFDSKLELYQERISIAMKQRKRSN